MTVNDSKTLVERLRGKAQNDEMIDQYFTEAGRLMNEAAAEIERLTRERDEARLEAQREILARRSAEARVATQPDAKVGQPPHDEGFA